MHHTRHRPARNGLAHQLTCRDRAATKGQVKAWNRRMKTLRQFSRVGPCIELGPLIRETDTRIYYRYRHDYEAFVSKNSSLAVHLEPCRRAAITSARNILMTIGTDRGMGGDPV